MSLIRVEQVGSNTLERAEKLLAGIPDGMNRAVKSAMTRAVSHLRTNSSKEIRKAYAISAGALRSEQNIKTKYTYHPGGAFRRRCFSAAAKFHSIDTMAQRRSSRRRTNHTRSQL